LSPIPEIPNSACISPELSPGPCNEPTSKSAKIISPNKIKKIKRLDKLDYKFDKKLKKVPKVWQGFQNLQKKETEPSGQEINSLNIYLKNKKEILKLIPQGKEKLKQSFMFLSKSPERPDSSLNTKTQSRRGSVPRQGMEDGLRSPRGIIEKTKDLKIKLKKQLRKNDVIIKFKPKKNIEMPDQAAKEIQNITRNILHKKL
jgi:hypothetical protein